MYIQINDELIDLNFNPHPYVKIYGPDLNYLVEMREYPKGEDRSLYIQSYKITTSPLEIWRPHFEIPIQFYGDWDILIYKFIPDYGMRLLHSHRYNDAGQLVLFNLDTDKEEEALIWLDRIEEYKKLHFCNIHIKSKFPEIDKKYSTYYQTHGLKYYKIYEIGRIPKQSVDFKTRDQRKHGLIWYGNWKTFWSYEHPRNWNGLSSREIVDDILGL